MKKEILVTSKFKQLVCCVGFLGLISGQVSAQMFGQPQDPTPSQEARAASPQASQNPMQENSDARGLPSIKNDRSEPLSFQNPQQQTSRLPQQENGSRLRNREGKEPNDVFRTYVQAVTGTRLDLFGRGLFTEVPTTFSPSEAAQVNGDYTIGAGDEIQIRGWGMINIDVTVTVDRGGAIYIPRVGSVKVAGVRYRDLQGHLKQAISKTFTNFELTASISQTRALQIYVVGHAVRPGTYTLNSMSTLLNALFSSGGPDASGSMRNIQIKRGNRTVTTFDLYEMLVKGDKSSDVSLLDGDVIYIPEIGPLVALTGNVKTPAIYELKGSASLADVLGWAGGVDSASQNKQIVVEKTVNNIYEMVAELSGDQEAINNRLAGVPIQPADVIRVFAPSAVPVRANLQSEYVRISGEAKQTGVFKIRKGETLRELMARIGGANDFGYLYALQLTRESVMRSQQKRLDEIAARFERDIETSTTARLSGTTDKDALTIQAAEHERQKRVAQRLREVKAEGRIVLELDSADAQVKNLPDLPLQDGDSIMVPRKPSTVDVFGSVFQGNSFMYKPGRTVKDYVMLAGGATDAADTSEIYLIRSDGTTSSGRSGGWFSGVGGLVVQPGDTVVVPEKIDRSSWRQSLKEWTAIFYQFGLGAAGLKVLQN